ncbi:helix-turn-helix domain-containing protein [Acetobacter sacchari]|uniref:Helix-turn-helix domain-containing protein n=1 Tax=Acetobacter sacchari TaxID=2661687 RepID=A0ABS3M0I2_9PROT|nr:helix-turn-helix transcriptional regulator [Acetobacter sacchari]MBO1361621.1 helix-turn-helix domain-containing protein [Acetobacter sacchari]
MTVRSSTATAIGAFLRARRDALSPLEVGLHPTPGRRRASGLRREEAAHICGISTTWYTWLEQGRDVSCSAATLGRIASALQLTAAERVYLFELARLKDPQTPRRLHDRIPAPVLTMPEQVKGPCYVLDRLWNICAANATARLLFGEWLSGDDPNLLRYVFLSSEAKNFLSDWEHSARRVLAEFRADSIHGEKEQVESLIETLRAGSSEFDRLWHDQAVLAREGGARRFRHTTDGVLNFEQTTLIFATWPQYKLVTLTPAPPASSTSDI